MSPIICNKNYLGGKPRIRGTRMSVDIIATYFSSGYGLSKIKKDYPQLTDKQIMSALDYLDKQIHSEKEKFELQTA